MRFRVVMVSGPRRAGKSAVISALLDEVCTAAPHYLRLVAKSGTKQAPRGIARSAEECGVRTARWVDYDLSCVFEVLPEALAAIHRRDRHGCVLIEADVDPNLRHAYPYDFRVFVMPAPEDVHDVFRTPRQARAALQAVLHDTMAFAGEIYGMAESAEGGDAERHERRSPMSDTQITRLLHSPLGRDLACRTQCRPEYHDFLDCDVVVMNTGRGGTSSAVDESALRLEKLLRQADPEGTLKTEVFCCDIADHEDPRRQKLIAYFRDLYTRMITA